MSNDSPLSVAEIDEMIKVLQQKKRAIEHPVRIVIKNKPVKIEKVRKVYCTNCGNLGVKSEMEKVARNEYQHRICPERKELVVRFGFHVE